MAKKPGVRIVVNSKSEDTTVTFPRRFARTMSKIYGEPSNCITIKELARKGTEILKRAVHTPITVVGEDGEVCMVINSPLIGPDED